MNLFEKALVNVETELTNFFRRYGESFRDGERLSDFYGDCSMTSTPSFVGCRKGTTEVLASMLLGFLSDLQQVRQHAMFTP